MRILPIRLVLLLLAMVSISQPGIAADSDSCPTTEPMPHVVMVRGIAGYWPNVDGLAEAIMSKGYTTSIHHPLSAIRSADELACYCRNHTPGQSVSIVAYSLGADAAIILCEKLLELGLEVDCLILIETTFNKNEIPANVRYCFNLYEERGMKDRIPAFRGLPVSASSDATVLTNAELTTTDLPAKQISHFNIAAKEETHHLVLKQLLSCKGCVR